MLRALDREEVYMHPMVRGELALGQSSPRAQILADLDLLPMATIASDPELLEIIESTPLHGRGIGYVDCHLLASARLTLRTRLWTLDKRLHAAALALALAHDPRAH